MKHKIDAILVLIALMLFPWENALSQQNDMLVRMSEIEVYPEFWDEYNMILKEEAEASVRLESGVIAIFPMYEKDNPNEIRILEMYADWAAYQSHLKTPHFLKYKTSTPHMIKSLKLIDMDVIDPASMKSIFSKLNVDTAQTKKYQARPPALEPFGAEAFEKIDKTEIRWLGNGGFFINSHGTTMMVDPLLQGFDMPVLFEAPIAPKDVPHLDAVLITHGDNDHYSIPTLKDLAPVTQVFHSTMYVDSLMTNEGFASKGHKINGEFLVGDVKVRLTPADHDWQNENPDRTRQFKKEDDAGFLIETPDGTIWAQGDSRLLPEHLALAPPDAIFFDFSDNEWHFTLEGAVKIANAYPDTPLLLSHWGTVDAPDFTPFNGDPAELKKLVMNPERVVLLAPGEPYVLKPLKRKTLDFFR